MHSSSMRTVYCNGRLGGGGVLPGGLCLAGMCTPPPVDRMTDACENITFPQLLLRTAKSPIIMESISLPLIIVEKQQLTNEVVNVLATGLSYQVIS